jgi:hypothetical protein
VKALWRIAVLAALSVAFEARAGMPSFDLNDAVELRLQDISFFLLLIGVSAFGFQRLWNFSFRPLPKVPQLGFKHALGLTAIFGLLMLLVLTMISGARELLTPGAWRKQGSTYLLNSPANEEQRRDHLLSLFGVLQNYRVSHDGKWPPHEYAPEIPSQLWRSLDPDGTRMVYVNWPGTDSATNWLVIEPKSFGSTRLGVTRDGEIHPITPAELKELYGRK